MSVANLLSLAKKVSFDARSLPFEVTSTPIDYFKLLPERFTEREIAVTKKSLTLTNRLEVEHFDGVDSTIPETVVLNTAVGTGKSTAFYRLIKQYHDDGYLVLVCSAFKKLVDKDCAMLRGLANLSTFNYQDLKDVEPDSEALRS